MTQQKTLDLFATLSPRIPGAGYKQLEELYEFSAVDGAMPNGPMVALDGFTYH